MKIILDTDVIVAALRSPRGASAELLRLARQGRFRLLVSAALAMEYEAVCTRTDHLRAAELSLSEVGLFLDAIVAFAEPVETHYIWRPQLRDPADEMILEAAINGRCDLLVSFNVRHFMPASKEFGIAVMPSSEALRIVRGG
jgi:putative PIN family toxin of toxin-antitoxin system